MSIGKDDPRLTAYALGEMDDPADRAAFEKEIEGDPSARAEVEAIRAVAAALKGELAAEPAPGLTDAQRASVERGPHRGIPWWIVPLAAGALVAVTLAYNAARRDPEAMEVAHKERDEQAARERTWEYERRTLENTQNRRHEVLHEEPRPDAYGKDFDVEVDAVAPVVELAGDVPAGRRDPSDPEPPPPPSDTGSPPLVVESRLRVERGVPGPVLDPAAGVPVQLPGRAALLDDTASPPSPGAEAYDRTVDNPFRLVAEADTSTFSIDVDTASYANVRRFLLAEGRLPPPDAVRIEEMVNYFDYAYEPPSPGPHPFAARVEVATCPWNARHRLARIALKGRVFEMKQRPPTNLVFLLDVSGSMRPANKLPLVRQAMHLLVDQLDEGDSVGIVVYAGAAGLVLPPTPADRKAEIRAALDRLEAGGSTNGGQGIQLAYDLAAKHFIKGGVNRVILATDGDFNVGISDRGSLTRMIEEKAKSGVFLSVLGVGTGNLKDAMMEELSNKGNGNYAYLDSLKEAEKVLVRQAAGTLVTIAKDVKIQVFFNPRTVAAYRLVGYENRLLAKEDFNDDTKDAGEIGAGHSVTALYELVPAGADVPGPRVDPNPFVAAPAKPAETPVADPEALFRLRLRYKAPEGDTSTLMESDVRDGRRAFHEATADFQWAAAVASFGMALRDSPHRGGMSFPAILEIAKGAVGRDDDGTRAEFLAMVEAAQRLSAR